MRALRLRRADNPEQQRAWLTFVIVGAACGVELARGVRDLAQLTLRGEFHPADATVLLVEGTDRVLPPYPSDLSAKAQRSLEKLGVTVRTQTSVTEVDAHGVTLREGSATTQIAARTVLGRRRAGHWARLLKPVLA